MRALIEAPLRCGEGVESLRVPVSCPRCGGQLEYVNGRPPGDTGLNTMALFVCAENACRRAHGELELRVELIPTRKTSGPPVGWTGIRRKRRST